MNIFSEAFDPQAGHMYLPGWLGQRNWASRSPKSLLTSSHQSFKRFWMLWNVCNHKQRIAVLYFSVLLMLKYGIGEASSDPKSQRLRISQSWWLRISQLRWFKNREIEKPRYWLSRYNFETDANTFSESWVHQDSVGTDPKKFPLKFFGYGVFCQKIHFFVDFRAQA